MAFATAVAGPAQSSCLVLTTGLSAQVQVGGSLALPEGLPQPACLFRAVKMLL